MKTIELVSPDCFSPLSSEERLAMLSSLDYREVDAVPFKVYSMTIATGERVDVFVNSDEQADTIYTLQTTIEIESQNLSKTFSYAVDRSGKLFKCAASKFRNSPREILAYTPMVTPTVQQAMEFDCYLRDVSSFPTHTKVGSPLSKAA